MLYEHFQIEGVNLLRDLVTDRDWLVKLDLNDAYSRINVAEKFQNVPNFFMKKNLRSLPLYHLGLQQYHVKLPIAILLHMCIRLKI